MAISKSICGNLNRRLKKRGMRISFRRVDGVEPKFEGPPFGLGSCICGFMVYAPVEVQYAPSSCRKETRSLKVGGEKECTRVSLDL